jgi:ubiquitin-protein ligase
MSWWLTNPSRAISERAEVARLQETNTWLTRVEWKFGENLQLIVGFDIRLNDVSYSLQMIYPSAFPDTTPIVLPIDNKQLSIHQYGDGGELCLEIRPDNWNPNFTGSMMITSAYNLLSGERPEEGVRDIVPSAHQASIGRDNRASTMRFVIERHAMDILSSLATDTPTPISTWHIIGDPTWVGSLASIGKDSELWSNGGLKPSSSSISSGLAIRTERQHSLFDAKLDNICDYLSTEFPELVAKFPEDLFHGFVLLGNEANWMALNLFAYQGKQSAFRYKVITSPRFNARLPDSHKNLNKKRVAIVGCGSVGSKIAVSLARSGVGSFTLVDEDIFFQENCVRNDLDSRAIGHQKVDALATRIKDISPTAEITVRRVALGQQESAGVTESVMEELALADLLIDSTADPRAFNLTAAVSRRYRKPMLWCEVFSGGIGGIVARARPDLDPIPTYARAQINSWCSNQGVPWVAVSEQDYSAALYQGPPLIADDADVSIISSHASGFALDLLTQEQSKFPASAYMIGLTAEWIFQAPFDTWPIYLQPQGEWGESNSPDSQQKLKEFISSLVTDEDS